eukprot:EG_transcript_15254
MAGEEQYERYLASRRQLLAEQVDTKGRPSATETYDAIRRQATHHRRGLGLTAEMGPAPGPAATLEAAQRFRWCRGEDDKDNSDDDSPDAEAAPQRPVRDQKYWRKYRWRQPGDDDDAPEEEEEEEAAAAAADTKDAKPGGEAAPVAAAAEVGAGAHKSATVQWQTVHRPRHRRENLRGTVVGEDPRRRSRSPCRQRSRSPGRRRDDGGGDHAPRKRRRGTDPEEDRRRPSPDATERSTPRKVPDAPGLTPRAEDVPGYLSLTPAEKVKLKMQLKAQSQRRGQR